jgi:hypothetical protein
MVNFFYFLDLYFIHLPKKQAKFWDFGYKQIAEYVLKNPKEKIVIEQSYEQPFIYLLFYGASEGNEYYYPKNFRRNVEFVESEIGDVGLVKRYGNISFQGMSWPINAPGNDVIIASHVAAPGYMVTESEKFTRIKEISYPNGEPAFNIIEQKQ